MLFFGSSISSVKRGEVTRLSAFPRAEKMRRRCGRREEKRRSGVSSKDLERMRRRTKRQARERRRLRRRRAAKAQHPQTYGCPLLDYTSAGWKITSSVCVWVCVQELTLKPAEDYSKPLNFSVFSRLLFKITRLCRSVRACVCYMIKCVFYVCAHTSSAALWWITGISRLLQV